MNRRRQISRAAPAVALVLLMTISCTMISHAPPPEGWPVLRVTEHVVSNKEMRDVCVQYVGWGESPMACAELDLSAGTCDIWLSADYPDADVTEHERLHCLGHDHPGGTTIKRLLNEWKGVL